MTLKSFVTPLLAVAAMGAASLAAANGDYLQVTVTNLTRGQIFTPILVVSHKRGVQLFEAGQPASPELAALAEGGDIGPLSEALDDSHKVKGIADSGGLLGPGQSVTIKVKAHGAKRVSLAAMLVPTNDAFVALNSVRVPHKGSVTYTAVAYDAGSEPNDEMCVNIPGPCAGEGPSPEVDGEGFVHVHAGIHGFADLDAAMYDWRNPVARVTIKRVRH